jgi:peptidoglycan-associated lipoprotein
MHQPLRLMGILAIVALVNSCGQNTKPEMPQPASTSPSSTNDATAQAIPASGGEVSENVLSQTHRAVLEERIAFAFDRSDLSPEARGRMLAKVEILRSVPTVTLRIEGHADERGSDEYNLALSSRRAASALRLLTQHGIDATRLETVAYGEERPVDQAESEVAWALNRRAEFQVSAGRLAYQ